MDILLSILIPCVKQAWRMDTSDKFMHAAWNFNFITYHFNAVPTFSANIR